MQARARQSGLLALVSDLLLLASALHAYALTEGPYTYTVTDNEATITGFDTSYPPELSITNELGGYPVTSIGYAAFRACKSLTSVTIPASVTSIGNYAFYVCPALASVTIPGTVTSIGKYAFSYCPALTSVTIPDSVTSISNSAFGSCISLTAINVSPANPEFASIDGVLFDKDLTNLIQCPGGFSGHYTMPDNVTSIGDDAFFSCTSLTSVAIPRSVTAIGIGAFGSCTSLTSVAISDSVTSIVNRAFYNCPSLTSVLFTGSAPNIDSFDFHSSPATIYYLPAFASNWPGTYGERPTLCWNPQVRRDAGFGFDSNGFGFDIAGTTNIPVVVEACTNLTSGVWTRLTNATLGTAGSIRFNDPASTNLPTRYYRIVWP